MEEDPDALPVAQVPVALPVANRVAANLPGAPRRPNAGLIQESFYNGRVHLHEIKHLTCDLPNGIVAFCWGADFVRRNDLFVLSDNQAILHVEQVYEDIPPLEEFTGDEDMGEVKLNFLIC